MPSSYLHSVERLRHSLERLRAFRVRPERPLALSAEFADAARDLRKRDRDLAGVAQAWAQAAPQFGLSQDALRKAVLVGVSRGVLTIRVADASTRFALDRALRAGGEALVLRLAPAGLRKVRLVL